MAADQHQGHQGAGGGVGQRQQEQYQRGSGGDERNDEDDAQDIEKRHLVTQIELFETVVTDIADHEQTDENRQHKGKQGTHRLTQWFADTVEPDHAGDHRRRGGTGQALEIAFVGAAGLGVESGEAQGRRRGEDKGGQPAQLAEPLQ